MRPLDIFIICLYFLFSICVARFFYKRSGKNTEGFFLSGRKLPWWIAGTTMVATTFSADTPLAVTEIVAKHGIAGNWLWWNFVAGNILTVFFFAKLWRRAEILTDVEFIELRYSGKEAAFLRGFKAVYLGIFMNVIIMGWVNVALAEILKIIFGIDESIVFFFVIGWMLLVGIYAAVSGLWGISLLDMFQFVIAMSGCIILAVVVLNLPQIGGVSGLKKSLPPEVFNFFPRVVSGPEIAVGGIFALSLSAFIAHIMIQWWASWYPGSEPGGGGYVAQRMMSSKDERHSLLATLWFTIAHYALRPWPWIIVALAALVLYPDLAMKSKKSGYVLAMKDHLPAGLLGLLVAAFLAAYMSTISTHLNWGTSYIINDLYKRFISKDKPETHYVFASRIVILLLVLLSSLLIFLINSISGAWEFILGTGAGMGLVLILRWYWWRISAWSEIASMIIPVFAYAFTEYVIKIKFPNNLLFIVPVTTLGWIATTYLTRPVDYKTLVTFFNRVHPNGPGWNIINPDDRKGIYQKEKMSSLFFNWLIGIALVYLALFGIGQVVFQEYHSGLALLGGAVVLFIIMSHRLKKARASSTTD